MSVLLAERACDLRTKVGGSTQWIGIRLRVIEFVIVTKAKKKYN